MLAYITSLFVFLILIESNGAWKRNLKNVFASTITATAFTLTPNVLPCVVPPLLGSTVTSKWVNTNNIADAAETPSTSSVKLVQYLNSQFHTQFSYPQGFEFKTGQLSGERSLIAFTDPRYTFNIAQN